MFILIKVPYPKSGGDFRTNSYITGKYVIGQIYDLSSAQVAHLIEHLIYRRSRIHLTSRVFSVSSAYIYLNYALLFSDQSQPKPSSKYQKKCTQNVLLHVEFPHLLPGTVTVLDATHLTDLGPSLGLYLWTMRTLLFGKYDCAIDTGIGYLNSSIHSERSHTRLLKC